MGEDVGDEGVGIVGLLREGHRVACLVDEEHRQGHEEVELLPRATRQSEIVSAKQIAKTIVKKCGKQMG